MRVKALVTLHSRNAKTGGVIVTEPGQETELRREEAVGLAARGLVVLLETEPRQKSSPAVMRVFDPAHPDPDLLSLAADVMAAMDAGTFGPDGLPDVAPLQSALDAVSGSAPIQADAALRDAAWAVLRARAL